MSTVARSEVASGPERIFVKVVGVLTLTFLLAPMLVVAIASLDPGPFFTFPPTALSGTWFASLLGDQEWRSSFFLSLQIAALSAVCATVLGTLAGIAAARLRGITRMVVAGLFATPLVVPAIVLAISYYGIVLRLHLVGSIWTFVGANAVLTAPLVALLVMGSASRIDERVEYASLACGAGPYRTLWKVTVPLVAPTAIAGGAFAFIFAMGEVVMALFLVSPDRTPMAIRMFLEARQGPAPLVTAASTLLILASVAMLTLGAAVTGRSADPTTALTLGVGRTEPEPRRSVEEEERS